MAPANTFGGSHRSQWFRSFRGAGKDVFNAAAGDEAGDGFGRGVDVLRAAAVHDGKFTCTSEQILHTAAVYNRCGRGASGGHVLKAAVQYRSDVGTTGQDVLDAAAFTMPLTAEPPRY